MRISTPWLAVSSSCSATSAQRTTPLVARPAITVSGSSHPKCFGRHHLAHLQVVAEPDTQRFQALGAVANLQALWAAHSEQLDTLTLPFLAEGAVARQYPFGDLVRAGTRLAAGSDWPVSSPNPLRAIHVAVNRQTPGSHSDPLGGAHQRVALSDALATYTSGNVYVNYLDHDTGWVREGYLANLVVIEPDPFELAEAELHTATVTSTWIAGVPVFTRTD